MLSVIASDILAVVQPSTLKHPPQTLQPSYKLVEEYNTSAWAVNDSTLYLASAQTISRYDPSSKQLVALHTHNDGCFIRCLAVKEKSTVIYGAGCSIHVLECGSQKPRVTQSLGPYKHDVLSLSLSNDSTLLACGLSNAVYVHNLTTGSQTTFRGLPSRLSTTICTFHPHVRTRLLVGFLDQLFVYDTTRPSTPIKVIPMIDAGTFIQAIACSPFSKTLVAVAMSNGGVGLVDLEKEKGLFRTLSLSVPLTTISFSSEGASIYLGTENGKLLVQDLRALDKPPRSIIVSESGCSINTLAVQKKPKELPQNIKGNGTPKTLAKSMSSTPTSRIASTPLRSRVTRASSSHATTPSRRGSIAMETPKQTPVLKGTGTKKVLSPTRDPHGNTLRLEAKGNAGPKTKKAHPTANVSVPLKHRGSLTRSSPPLRVTGQANSSSNRRKISQATSGAPIATKPENIAAEEFDSISSTRNRSRSRMTPSTSEPTSGSISTAPRSARTVSSSSVASTTTRRKQPSSTPLVHPIPSISTDFIANLRPASRISESSDRNRTPSPDLPEIKTDPATPVPPQKKMKAMAVLGLGTPEVNAWIKAGMPKNRVSQHGSAQDKTRMKSVGFRDDDDAGSGHVEESDGHGNQLREREKSFSLEISPRRPLPASSLSQSHGHCHSWDASPMVRSRQTTHMPGTPSAGTAHELLKTIVKDVMYDFQRETRAEMTGLHLDLVRMGRGWKQELRTLMDEYVGDLKDLREENRRLREENDRLRRL